MFDLGFGEIALLALVLLVVVGPRDLPRLLRTIGRGISRLRNMSWELRSQSGIDEIIRDEELQKDIDAVRSLSKGRIVDAIVNEAMRPPPDPYRPKAEDLADAPDVTPAKYAHARDDDDAATDTPRERDDRQDSERTEVDRPTGRRRASPHRNGRADEERQP